MQKKNNLVYISALDGFIDRIPYGIQSWSNYCARMGVDFKFRTERHPSIGEDVNGSWYPWFDPDLLSLDWDNLLIVDADTMVSNRAPNIFDVTEGEKISVVRDSSPLEYGAIPHLDQWRGRFVVETNPEDYFNAGFMVMSRRVYSNLSSSIPEFFEYSQNHRTSSWEQTPLNIIASFFYSQDINYLGVEWNDMIGFNYKGYDDSYIQNSYVWHFTGPNYQTNYALRGRLMQAVYEKNRDIPRLT